MSRPPIPKDALSAMPYLGGKSSLAPQGVGRWIQSKLPYREIYAEPFAGMLGVLLSRKKSYSEIVNDTHSDLINWWRTIRDRKEEFMEYMAWTPERSREMFEWARKIIIGREPATQIERAAAYTVMVTNRYTNTYISLIGPSRLPANKLERLADRIRDVEIENIDANRFLEEKLARYEDAVIYCDPPYPSTEEYSKFYDDSLLDYERFEYVLLQQKGFVAVSGYRHDFDNLLEHGWTKHTYSSFMTANRGYNPKDIARTEALWCNQDAPGQTELW